jgi:hypothetical protein
MSEGVFADELIFDELVFHLDDGVGEHPPVGGPGRQVKGTHEYERYDYLRGWELHEARVKLMAQRHADAAKQAAMQEEEYVKWEADVAAHHEAVTQSVVQKVSGMEQNGALPTRALLSMSPEDFEVYKAWKKGLH